MVTKPARPGFMLYFELVPALALLNDEEAGRLLKVLMAYAQHGELQDLSGSEAVAFRMMRGRMDRDAEAYWHKCRKNAYNAYVSAAKRRGELSRRSCRRKRRSWTARRCMRRRIASPLLPPPAVKVTDFDDSVYQASKPVYTSNYAGEIGSLLDSIENRPVFSYDPDSDPLYRQYEAQYRRKGSRAVDDTLAAAASQAGGMNSYAVTAAQQAGDYYNAQLMDRIRHWPTRCIRRTAIGIWIA